jgi:hypothetical protein
MYDMSRSGSPTTDLERPSNTIDCNAIPWNTFMKKGWHCFEGATPEDYEAFVSFQGESRHEMEM